MNITLCKNNFQKSALFRIVVTYSNLFKNHKSFEINRKHFLESLTTQKKFQHALRRATSQFKA